MYNVAFIRIKRIRHKIESESNLCQTSFQFQFLVSVITTRLMLYTIWIVEAVYSCFIIPIYFEQFDIAHIWPATLINLTSTYNLWTYTYKFISLLLFFLREKLQITIPFNLSLDHSPWFDSIVIKKNPILS